MTKMTFYPLGNADTTLVELANGDRMLIDYADVADKSDVSDKRCDLAKLLDSDIKESKNKRYRIVAFTHLDEDHCKGASDYFWLEHAKKYQSDERKKIDTLWVPASAITEENLEDDAMVIRQEARYRLKEGKGIVVFSRPERLKKWMESEGISVKGRENCLVDAGSFVPGLTLKSDGVEVFAHSPHASRSNKNEVEDRNGDSLVFQMHFRQGSFDTNVLFAADVNHEVLGEIVDLTKKHNNEDKLQWHVFKLPHHCSYLSIGPEKGKEKTSPTTQTKWLFEECGNQNGYVISPSKPIPSQGSKEDKDDQPPHRQAANYYQEEVVKRKHFLVTMEKPRESNPKPIEIKITDKGAIYTALGATVSGTATGGYSPRVG